MTNEELILQELKKVNSKLTSIPAVLSMTKDTNEKVKELNGTVRKVETSVELLQGWRESHRESHAIDAADCKDRHKKIDDFTTENRSLITNTNIEVTKIATKVALITGGTIGGSGIVGLIIYLAANKIW